MLLDRVQPLALAEGLLRRTNTQGAAAEGGGFPRVSGEKQEVVSNSSALLSAPRLKISVLAFRS